MAVASSAADLPSGWVETDVGGLHLALPGVGKIEKSPTKASSREFLKTEGMLYLQVSTDVNFAQVTLMDYKQRPGLMVILAGVEDAMKLDPKMTELTWTQHVTRVNGRPAAYADLSYRSSGQPQVERLMVVGDGGGRIWQISLITKPGQLEAPWKLIADSIRIDAGEPVASVAAPAPVPALTPAPAPTAPLPPPKPSSDPNLPPGMERMKRGE